jgi:soluble lytic murein transglycosylase-like protein
MKHYVQRLSRLRDRLPTTRPAGRVVTIGATGALLIGSVAFMGDRRPAETEAFDDLAELTLEEPRTNAAFDAWLDHVREREVESVAATFSTKFRISPQLAGRIYAAADAEGIRPEVAFGLVRAESSFRPRVVSRAGAVGLTQVLPSTGRWIAPGTSRSDLFDPDTNLRVGFRYLRYLYDKYDGDERLALTAYNRGPGTVDGQLRRGRNPDNGYAEMVMTGSSRRHTALMNARFRS